ncbi:MAG: hypothetical protein RH949_11515 [Coleofasciculus sp. A1-SPW-01]|uniref:hypothetical protein n=1 Tax=Coleofasciculus TaxID=669368 RepID=UPI0032FA9914
MALTGMLVGNAHPTVAQGFWCSQNAYFSAIRPKSDRTSSRNHAIALLMVRFMLQSR